ncbi:MAG TPA: Rieske 2Fe-2S domain-containing protein [Thermoanaerobaculia bacterium]|nr:Rieske 2Fe-2S domain-containing protein [Thermoanaerobaculia bacterium]
MSNTATSGWRLPDRLQSWYRVCGSRDLPPGGVLRWDLPGRSFVLFRGREDGQAHALAAHCAHMGTHLSHGAVVGDSLRCPLHHWAWDGNGACRTAPGLRQRVFPVAERYGSVFLFNGPVPRYPAPELSSAAEEKIRMLAGAPVRLRCPWPAVASNGFDTQHLESVHGRALREGPVLERLDPYRLRMHSVLSVTGQALEDRAIRWISGDRVRLTVTCFGGTVIAVESDLGRTRSALFLCLRPVSEGVEIVPVFGIHRSGLAAWDALRVHLARRLYTGFIRKDVAFMDDMRFHPSAGGPFDSVLSEFLDFLRQLPEDGDAQEISEAVVTPRRQTQPA